MSYATSLRMAYPPPYGPSTLLSDDLVRQSSFTSYYYSALPYSNTNYLLNNTFRYDYSTNYRTPSYTNWQRNVPAHTSYASINNIREYSESLGTTSNTNTASSLARSIDETNHRRNSQVQTIPNPKVIEEKPPAATHRSLPELSASKLKPKTPELSRNPTVIEIERQPTVVDVQARVDEAPKDDDQQAEQAWTQKIDQLHTNQTQREKERAKLSRAGAASTLSKTVNDTNVTPKQTNSYFDSLFEGNFIRKPSTNQQHLNSSYQQKFVSLNKPKTTVFQRKFPAYEPPTIKKSQPVVPTYKPPVQKQPATDSQTPRENIHLEDGERFRQALQRFRLDRAEQQQREATESTAKRKNYDVYVRQSVRTGSLRTPIKPLPWTDFFDLKKGNLYSLDKEEKKDLYNQSRSYGERIRNRNFALQHHPQETTRIVPFPTVHEETQSVKDEDEDEEEEEEQPSKPEESVRSSSSTVRPTEDDDVDISEFHQTSRTSSSTN